MLLMTTTLPMTTLLIVWHSRTGTARQLGLAAERGARAALREAIDDDGGPRVETPASAGDVPAMTGEFALAASQGSCRVVRAPAARVGGAELLAASAYLFVAPENLAGLSGTMKEFFDRTYYGALDRIAGRPYGVIVAAGTDGQGAARQITRIATGWRLRAVAEPLIVRTGAQTPAAIAAPKRIDAAAREQARSLGALLAGGVALGVF